MKKWLFVLLIVFGISSVGYAATDAGKETAASCKQTGSGMMGEGMPMMQQMMGQNVAMKEMMQMMMDIMKMQKTMLNGAGGEQRVEMMKDMDRMMDRLNRMMSDMNSTMMKGMAGAHHTHAQPGEKREPAAGEAAKAGAPKEETPKAQTPKADPHKH